jgi:NADH:ubiquinone oxidoreductase subunit 2 (subunit N)
MRLRRINTALPGLLCGIILFGIICQIIGLFFVDDKANYSIGLWIGVLTAIFMAFHMAVCLNKAVELGEKGAQTSATRNNIIRYLVVVIVLGVLMMTNIGNPLSAFLGVMGLKFAAYLQPIYLRLTHHDRFSQDEPDKIEN